MAAGHSSPLEWRNGSRLFRPTPEAEIANALQKARSCPLVSGERSDSRELESERFAAARGTVGTREVATALPGAQRANSVSWMPSATDRCHLGQR